MAQDLHIKPMMRQAKGFTLLELMVVIVIIGIMAAIAIPNFRDSLPKSRVNAAARELFTEMQLARMKAISENNYYVITFDTGNNSYSIYDDDDSDFTTEGVESGELVKTIDIDDKHQGIEYYSTTESSDVTFTGSPKRVIFYSTGLASVNGSVYLMPTADKSSGRTDRQRKITVISTGRARLYRHTGSGWD